MCFTTECISAFAAKDKRGINTGTDSAGRNDSWQRLHRRFRSFNRIILANVLVKQRHELLHHYGCALENPNTTSNGDSSSPVLCAVPTEASYAYAACRNGKFVIAADSLCRFRSRVSKSLLHILQNSRTHCRRRRRRRKDQKHATHQKGRI